MQGAEMTPPTENFYDLEKFGQQDSRERADGLNPDRPDGLDDDVTTRRMQFERMMRENRNGGPPAW